MRLLSTLTFFGCLLGLSTMASAQSVDFLYPTQGADVHKGVGIDFKVRVNGSSVGLKYVEVLTVPSGQTNLYGNYQQGQCLTLNVSGRILIALFNPYGSYNLLQIHYVDYLNGDHIEWLRVNIVPDTGAPLFAGLDGATRLPGNRDVQLTWSPGSDTLTPVDQLEYHLFYSANAETVFSTPRLFFPDVYTGTVSNLEPGTTYFFGMRVADNEGNDDGNTVIIKVDPLPSAIPSASWAFYE